MRFRPALAAIAAVALAAPAFAQSSPYGTWTRPSTGTQVDFFDCGGKLCAKVKGVKDATKQDAVGKSILTGAAKSGDNVWKGDLLNLEDGKTYAGNLTVLNDKELKLEGCTLAVLCKGETWKKVN